MNNLKPVLKWAGGKRQLLKDIEKLLPESFNTYFEPFVGGGAVLFHMQPKKAIISDLNEELINVYRVIKCLRFSLVEHFLPQFKNTKECFHKVRNQDRNADLYAKMYPSEKAARTIYLNKTCFNGLYRVNSKGQFNAPYGYYKNPNFCDYTTINAISDYFKNNDIQILNLDFHQTLGRAKEGDFAYIDPPYDVEEGSKNFTAYTKSGFDRSEQIRLKNVCDTLTEKGVKFLLSNSNTDFINDLYKNYDINQVLAKRSINSDGKGRGKIKELLIKNY